MCGLSRCSCFGGYGGTEAPPPPPPLPPPSRSPPPLPASTARATERWWLACDEDRATEENSRLERERGFRRTPLVTGVRLATRARRFESLDTLEEEKRERVRKRGVERGSGRYGGKNLAGKESRGGRGEFSGDEGRRKKARDVGRRTENACQLDNSTSTSRPWLPPSRLSPRSWPPAPFVRKGVWGGGSKGKGVRGWHAGEYKTIPGGETIHQSVNRRARVHDDGHD